MPEDQNQPGDNPEQSQSNPQSQPKPEQTDSSQQDVQQDQPSETELVNKQLSQEVNKLIKEKAEYEQRVNALKGELSNINNRLPDEEEIEAFKEWKQKKEERALKRKKEAGKYEEIIAEKEREWNHSLQTTKQQYEEKLQQIAEEKEKFATKLKNRVINSRVRSELKGLVPDDVIDIVSREVVDGEQVYIDLDENDQPVVLDKKTGSPAWTEKGRLSVGDYVNNYLNKYPSFRKANVTKGSDDGAVNTTAPTMSEPKSNNDDQGVPIANLNKQASAFASIENAVKQRSQGRAAGFRNYQRSSY